MNRIKNHKWFIKNNIIHIKERKIIKAIKVKSNYIFSD